MLQDDDTALAITRAQQKKLEKEEGEARIREMEDEVLPTPLEEDCPEPEELHDADFVEEGERSLSNPHTEEVEESVKSTTSTLPFFCRLVTKKD